MRSSNFGEMAIITIASVVALGIISSGNVQAAQCSLIPRDKSIMDWEKLKNQKVNRDKKALDKILDENQANELFKDGQFQKLDAILEKWHRENRTAPGGDLLTLRSLNGVMVISDGKQNLLLMWLDQRPQSFFAQLAMGIYLIDMSAVARGDKVISETSETELSEMGKIDAKAITYLQKAIQLDPHSALPHAFMINIAGREGEAAGKTAQQWLEAANQVDPKNLYARITATNFLSPRWGGSFELLDQIVQQAAKSLPSESLEYLKYNVVLSKASHEEVIEKDKTKAHTLYKQAKEMCENSQVAQDGIIRTYQ